MPGLHQKNYIDSVKTCTAAFIRWFTGIMHSFLVPLRHGLDASSAVAPVVCINTVVTACHVIVFGFGDCMISLAYWFYI